MNACHNSWSTIVWLLKMSEESFSTAVSDLTNRNGTGSITSTKGRFKVVHIEEMDEGTTADRRPCYRRVDLSRRSDKVRDCPFAIKSNSSQIDQIGRYGQHPSREGIGNRNDHWEGSRPSKDSLWLSRWNIYADQRRTTRRIDVKCPVEYLVWCVPPVRTEHYRCDCVYSTLLGDWCQWDHRRNDHHWPLLPMYFSHSYFPCGQ